MIDDLHVLDLLPEYALGSLEVDEARTVSSHLAECLSCREELVAYQRVADQLALAAPEQNPSEGLKTRLLERIHRLSEKPLARSSGWRLLPRWVPVGAFTGLVLILLLVASNLVLWQRLDRLEVISGPLGMRAIALQNTDAASAASAFVVMSADGENGVLVVDELPVLDEGYEYQVWLVKENANTSGGTFAVDEDGYRGLRLTAPDSLLTYSDLFVTVEPAGGSAVPTGANVLNGSLFAR